MADISRWRGNKNARRSFSNRLTNQRRSENVVDAGSPPPPQINVTGYPGQNRRSEPQKNLSIKFSPVVKDD